ncbi:LegC family aminotransferase [Achromobacter sp. MY14]|uniref:LegC family aminotransferase n=1 Tax=Achromobacter TaxID=222 RepID=UPI000F8FA22F|nr:MULTISPECIES: LegC family aminotransferase [Achromobacter]AZS82260.1 LegC family aminotransferase [Achromobacter spanius]MCD0496500.1 LegC family aminotransferase [Achromobacter sp. MY14]
MSEKHYSLEQQLLAGLHQVLGKPESLVALHEPEFRGNEWSYVKECIDTGWVSSVGKYVDEFERRLAEVTGAKHAVAIVNGTAALQIALNLAGVKPGDEVIIPALSFVGTANSVSHCQAIPHFVDSNMDSLGLDPELLEAHFERIGEHTPGGLLNRLTGRRIAAIVPMHAFGFAVDLDRLMAVARRFGVPIVEDAAESLGTTYKGRHTGTFGDLGILSFNGNKVITTGGGGAIITNDSELARRAKYLTTTAKRPHRWEFFHDEVAYNYRLPNLNAALGCAQLELLPEFLQRKRVLADNYRQSFEATPDIAFVSEQADCHSNYWLNVVRLRTPDIEARNRLLDVSNEAGFQCRPAWTLLHKLPMYTECPRAELPVALALEASLINIPSSPKLSGKRA